jgi:hypothetical protein
MSTDADHQERQVLASMHRLQNDADFNRFMTQYIGSLLTEYTQHCIDAENPARVQGAAQVLQRIQREVAGAEEAYYKLTNQAEIPLG